MLPMGVRAALTMTTSCKCRRGTDNINKAEYEHSPGLSIALNAEHAWTRHSPVDRHEHWGWTRTAKKGYGTGTRKESVTIDIT